MPTDYEKQKCYKVLQGLDVPCRFCTNGKLSGSHEYSWKHYNEKLRRQFSASDSLVHLGGRPCRGVDGQLSVEDILFHCLNTLTKGRGLDVAANLFLEAIGSYYKANRAYIIEFDLDAATADNTFEW